MGLTELHIFDTHKVLRRVLVEGVSELLHDEGEWRLSATVPKSAAVKVGEYLGFFCVDGAYRLFCADETDESDDEQSIEISAVDAAVDDMAGRVLAKGIRYKNAGAAEVMTDIVSGTDWQLGSITADGTANFDLFYPTMWDAVQRARKSFDARVILRYSFEDGQITGKVIDLVKKESAFCGHFFDTATDAENVSKETDGRPATVLYGLGKSISTGDNPDRLTFADVEWSKAKGDPADKPKGQKWVGDAQQMAKYGRVESVYSDQYEDDAAELLKRTWEELEKLCKPSPVITATVADLEKVPGYEHQRVRMYDRVAIVQRDGSTEESLIVGIRRDYVKPWKTKIRTGEEKHELPDIARELAKTQQSVKRLSGRVGGHGAGIEEQGKFIVENQESIRLHTIKIDEQGKAIEETEIRMGDAEVNISANKTQLTEQGERISDAEVKIDGANAAIELNTKDIKANGESISAANLRIDGANAEIALRVKKDGVISAINLTTEAATISAAKINLEGYVTATKLSTELANLKNGFAESLYTKTLSASEKITFTGTPVHWNTVTFLTKQPTLKTTSIAVAGGGYVTVVTGYSANAEKDTKYLLGS